MGLTSDSAAVSVPAAVTVPGGSAAATFQVSASTVTADVLATITGSLSGTATLSFIVSANDVAKLSVTPTTVLGGTSLNATVTLKEASGAFGTRVTLDGDPANIIGYQAMVPAGQSTLTFSLPTGGARSNATLKLHAYVGDQVGVIVPVTFLATQFTSVTTSVPSVPGGTSLTGYLNFTGAVPSGGYAIQLASNDPAVSVQPVVDTPAGATSVPFQIFSSPVASSRPASFTATLGSVTQTCTFTVTAPGLTAITPQPSAVWGGQTDTATATISSPAPVGGLTIPLTSNSPYATVPATVLIPAGAKSGSFVISTSMVSATEVATISGTFGSTVSAQLTIKGPSIGKVWFDNFTPSGGNPTWGHVNLVEGQGEGQTTVTLTSSSSDVTIPASVVIPAGADETYFRITTKFVTSPTPVTISASLFGTASAVLTLRPFTMQTLGMSPPRCYGATNAKLVFRLSDDPEEPISLTVGLTSSNPLIPVPATAILTNDCTIPIAVPIVSADATTTITATLNGSTQSVQLTDFAPVISSISGPGWYLPVVGGMPWTSTIKIMGTAPEGGLKINLTSNSPDATVPASVTVPYGSSSVDFTINTKAVSKPVSIQMTAKLLSHSSGDTFGLVPPSLSTLSVSPTSVKGGASVTGKVTLNGPAPTGGSKVALVSSSALIKAPSYVVVPANATSASFTIRTKKVDSTTMGSVGGTLGTSQAATLTLTH